ncbi:EXPERA domain-containing protein [Calothrix rhizosoleniae]|uniref:EXPERA domain-containing protein n=1 Tax=Calothrix rhizosoleniae TaxID=888997 RepID=UPI000B4A3BB1|nr:emopamil-binding family protein [Calothrix rhizosoleniae]
MHQKKPFLNFKRRYFDYFFIICFSFFAWTSFFTSSLVALNIPITPESNFFLIRALYWYGTNIDPALIKNPLSLQIQSLIDIFIFGPFYLLLVYAFIKGKNWIRLPAIIYVSAITYSMILYLGIEFMGDNPPSNHVAFLAINLPYLLIPLALGYRMRKTYPFNKNSV